MLTHVLHEPTSPFVIAYIVIPTFSNEKEGGNVLLMSPSRFMLYPTVLSEALSG